MTAYGLLIDYEWCTGCHTCECDLCAERVGKGKVPTCVHHCQAKCIEYGPVDELAAKLAEKPKQSIFRPAETK